jgi:segregation and condensation protein B
MSVQESEETFEIDEATGSDVNESNASPDTLRILEALLFASDELLTAARLKTILPGNPDARQIRKMADKINVQLQKERHPFEIVEIGGGYQFRTVAFYHTWVRQIFKEKASKKLSVQALECLAIIAYKQPLSKAEIEAIRGVVSDGAMKTLLEKHLVVISGRSEKPGRPLLYATSGEFLKYFGLNKIADLPRIEEFEAIAREKMEELSIEELTKNEEKSSDIESDEEMLETTTMNTSTDGGAENAADFVQNDATKDGAQGSNSDIAAPEATAVFEISADKEMEDQVEDNDLDMDFKTTDSAADEIMDSALADADVGNEDNAPSLESSEKINQPNSSQIEQNMTEDETETFDLEISFDSEEVEQMLPSEVSAIAASAGAAQNVHDEECEPEISDQKTVDSKSVAPQGTENAAADEEEMLEIFLSDESIDSSEDDSSEKKR